MNNNFSFNPTHDGLSSYHNINCFFIF
jgi:hypothetical protein